MAMVEETNVKINFFGVFAVYAWLYIMYRRANGSQIVWVIHSPRPSTRPLLFSPSFSLLHATE